MQKIQAALAAVADKLGITQARLASARRRHRRQRKRATRNHDAQIRYEMQADKNRAANPNKAASLDRKAARSRHRAEASHARAQYLVGLVKRLVQRTEDLSATQAQLVADAAKWKKDNGIKIEDNKVTGGSQRKRIVAAALASAAACSSGKRANFYSQLGAWDIEHCITGEHYGERSDCSSWVTSAYHSAGCADPNGNGYAGGYTGTLVAHGKQVARTEKQPGDLVIYGPGTGHHVELYTGPGEKTIGHGSAPVDAGTVNLFGDSDYRIFRYIK